MGVSSIAKSAKTGLSSAPAPDRLMVLRIGRGGGAASAMEWLIGRLEFIAGLIRLLRTVGQDWILHDGHAPYILGLLFIIAAILCVYPVTIRSPVVWAEETQWWYLGSGCLPDALQAWRRDIIEAGPPFV